MNIFRDAITQHSKNLYEVVLVSLPPQKFAIHVGIIHRTEEKKYEYGLGFNCMTFMTLRQLAQRFYRGQECVELYIHFPNTYSWRGA